MEMDELTMIDLHAVPLSLSLPICFAVGLLLGLAYFSALRRTTELILGGGSPLLAAVLTLGRFAGLGAGFYLAVLAGGFALLTALGGVLLARRLILGKTEGGRA